MLIVSAYFPPATQIGARRPYRLACAASQYGWDTLVLSTLARCTGAIDKVSSENLPSDLRIRRAPCRSIWNHATWWRLSPVGIPRVVAFVQAAAARLTESLVPLDEFYPWARSAISQGVNFVEDHGIDLIWSTGPPLSSLYLGHCISQSTGVEHVADFRDVRPTIALKDRTWREKIWYQYEEKILRVAVGVTYTAQPQWRVLTNRYPWLRTTQAKLVHNWFDKHEWRRPVPKAFGQPTILHGGELYGGTRRVRGLFEGLSQFQRRSSTNHELRFIQLGDNKRDVQVLSELRSQFGLEEIVSIRPRLARHEFISACLGADALLLVVGHDTRHVMHHGAIPGKLYDYLAAGRPILTIGPPGCEAGRIVEDLNRGIAVADDSPIEIATAISNLLVGRGRRGQLDLSERAVAAFESTRAIEKIMKFLSSVSFGTGGEPPQNPSTLSADT